MNHLSETKREKERIRNIIYFFTQATFYVSYFNCLVIFSLIVVFMVEIYYNPFNNEKNPFGSATAIYEFVNCWPGPDGNQDNSWLR